MRETGNGLAALKRCFQEGIVFSPANQGGVGVGKDVELTVEDRDRENIFLEADVGDGPLNCKLSKETSHLLPGEMEGYYSRGRLSPNGDREPAAFPGNRFSKKVDHDGAFPLDQFSEKQLMRARCG